MLMLLRTPVLRVACNISPTGMLNVKAGCRSSCSGSFPAKGGQSSGTPAAACGSICEHGTPNRQTEHSRTSTQTIVERALLHFFATLPRAAKDEKQVRCGSVFCLGRLHRLPCLPKLHRHDLTMKPESRLGSRPESLQ